MDPRLRSSPCSSVASLPSIRQILGIRFYSGPLADLLPLTKSGGLIVVPSAPVLVGLAGDPAQRAALEGSDLAITDSGYMVLLWRLFQGEALPRHSGLKLMRALLADHDFRRPGQTYWVMPSAADASVNCAWLNRQGIPVGAGDCFVAPFYPQSGPLADEGLLAAIEARRPRFVMLNLGGGVQERLGLYLRDRLSYRPAVFCTGAAIAFLSGRQASIPVWADRLMLGWLIRSLRNPGRFLPRYWAALRLAPLLWRHGSRSVAVNE